MSAEAAAWSDYDKTVAGQFMAADPERSAWVAANAGSGKTKVLIDRVARLLLDGAAPDAVLCVTYTKAAASEMQTRLFRRLGGWCVAEDAALRADLGVLQGRDPGGYDASDLGKARELFARALETPGGLRIETLHAFCGRLLRRFPLEAGAPPGFRELDDGDAARLWSRSVEALGAAAGGGGPLAEAVRALASAAGARGVSDPLKALNAKRTELTAFIARSGGVDAAQTALRIRLDAPTEREDDLIEHAIGAALPKNEIAALIPVLDAGAKSDRSAADALRRAIEDGPAASRLSAYASMAFTQSGAPRTKNAYTKSAAASAFALDDLFNIGGEKAQGREITRLFALEQKLVARRTFERSAALLRAGDAAYSDYAARKRARAALDFDDLVETAAGLLTRRAAAEWVLWKLDGGLSHVLLDEAQDTSQRQWALLNALTQDFFAGLSAEKDIVRTLFVVGDEKQSIYSFQGADPERFLSERRVFAGKVEAAGAAGALPDMEMSFRSAPEVLQFVDAVFASDAFDGEAPFSIAPPPEADLVRHTAFRREAVGRVELWPLIPPEPPPEADAWDAPAGQERETSPKAQLAQRVAQWVRGAIDRGELIGDGAARRPVQPGDVMILVRGRKGGLFDALLKALKRAGLPVAGADRIDLLDSAPVQDALNLIRFALRPEDDLALAEILTGPLFGWTEDAQLFPLAFDRGDESLWSRLKRSDTASAREAGPILERIAARAHAPPLEFLLELMETPGADGRDRDGPDALPVRIAGARTARSAIRPRAGV